MSKFFTVTVDNGKQYLDIQHAAVTINGVSSGTYEVNYDWASAADPALTNKQLTRQVLIEVPQVAAATTQISIASDGKYGDGTGFIYICIPTLSDQVIRSEMNLAILYGVDSAYYNLNFIYGPNGAADEGESEAHPLSISGPSPKKTVGSWKFKKPIITGVRQLHPANNNKVTITQRITADQADEIQLKIARAVAGSKSKGDNSLDYLNPDQPWRNHWTVVDAEQRIYSRTYTSIEEVLTESENSQNFSSVTSDYLLTNTGRSFLQNQLRTAVRSAGFGSREAVVAAAKYLTVAFPYDINYVSGNGGNHYDGVTEVPNTSCYTLNYSDGLNIDSETTSWGSMDDALLFQSAENKVENPAKLHGLNCSSFTNWAIFNGGFNLNNDIDNLIAYYDSKVYDFNRGDGQRKIVKVVANYLGWWIGGTEASNQNSFDFTAPKDVAHSYHPSWNDARKALRNGIQPGDLVTKPGHVGMVIEVTDEYIYTVDSVEHQNDYARCFNSVPNSNGEIVCKARANRPNVRHSGIYIQKFAADHGQNVWHRIISMDYVYNNPKYRRNSSQFYGVS